MTRIAQLANFYSTTSGGLRTAVDALGRGYVSAGHERLLLVPGPEDSLQETENGAIMTFRAPLVGGNDYRMVVEPWRVREALDRFRPTSIEVSDKTTMVLAAGWARRRGVRSVLLSHERLDSHLAPRIRWQTGLRVGSSLVNRYLLRAFDQVVVTSAFAAEEFRRVGGTSVVRVPLGVDLTTFHPGRRPSGTLQGLPKLLHVGRLSYEKRPDLAISAAVELHRRGAPFDMDVYGDGPDRAELVRLADDAPVTFHPHFTDRSELAKRIAAADVSLSVCPGETFGLAILEALACGTPVVTADLGGGRELITPECGAFAPATTPALLADAVLQVLDLPETARREAARERAEQYPWSAAVDRMLEIHSTPVQARRLWRSGAKS
ncbi:glycosyltransferase family protein [Flindersiella endophytica]